MQVNSQAASPRPLRRALLRIARFVIAIAPIVWIFARLDLGGFLNATSRVAWWCVPLIVLNILVAMFLQGYRWWLLMRAFLRGLSLAMVMKVHFKSLFYSIVLPTSAAQDVVRAALLSTRDDYPIVWGASWVCRLLGLFALLGLSVLGLAMMGISAVPSWVVYTIAAIGLVLLGLAILSFSKSLTRHLRGITSRLLPAGITTVIEQIRQAVYLYRTAMPRVGAAFVISVAVQVLVVLNAVVLIKGIAGTFFFKECTFFIPAIEIVVVSLPLTPNGMGIREALLSLFLMSSVGFSPEQIGVYVLIGLLGILLRTVGIVPVLYDWLRHR